MGLHKYFLIGADVGKKITRTVLIVWQVLNKREAETALYFDVDYRGPLT